MQTFTAARIESLDADGPPTPPAPDPASRRADFRAPLGRAIIGGVIASTLLTLLVIPTVYEILDELKEWSLTKIASVRKRLWGRRMRLAHEPGD